MDLLLNYDSKYQPVSLEHINDLNMFAEVYFNLKPDDIEYFIGNKKLDLSNICLSELLGQEVVIKKKEDIDLIRFQEDHITHHLVFIDVYCQSIKFKAIIDTGCQRTMITKDIIEKIGIDDTIDTSHKMKMSGVGGLQETIGIIRNLELKLNNRYLVTTNVQVVEPLDTLKNTMLIGLDFMHMYDFSINVRKNKMIIEGISIDLLNEIEIEELKEPINWQKEVIKNEHYKLVDRIGRSKIKPINQTINSIFNNILRNPYDNKYRSINPRCKQFIENPEIVTFLKSLDWFEKDNKLVFSGTNNLVRTIIECIS